MAGNLGDLLRADYIAQYGLTIPQEMFIIGVSPGTPLAAALVLLWAAVNWSLSSFDQISAAYFNRSAPYNVKVQIWSRRRLLEYDVPYDYILS